jgi:uncharacterized protein
MENKKRMLGVMILVTMAFLGNQLCFGADSTENEVYNHFFAVIGTEAQYNQMTNSMISQYAQTFASGVKDIVKKIDKISEKDQTEVQKLVNESMAGFNGKIKDKIRETVPYQDLVNNIYIPVYKKYFTNDEIKDITKFYESGTGKKMVSLASSISQEVTTTLGQTYNQKIMQISKDAAEAEYSRTKQAIEALEKK